MVVANKQVADPFFEMVMEFRAKNPGVPWFVAHQELVVPFHTDEVMVNRRCEKFKADCISILERQEESEIDRHSWGSSAQDMPRALSNSIAKAARAASLGLGLHGRFRVYIDAVLFLDGSELIGGSLLGARELFPDSEMFRRIAVKDLLNDLEPAMKMQVVEQSRLSPFKYLGPEDFLVFDALRGAYGWLRR